MKHINLKQCATIFAGLIVASGAYAQYVWLDDHGVKQFSDAPPPASVPQEHILKQPHRSAAAATDSAPANDAKSDNSASPTTAEKNAEFAKRQKEKADKEKKAEQDATLKAQMAEDCTRANSYLNSLKSGMRITTTNDKGERSYISDADRAREEEKTQALIDKCK